MTMKKCIFMLVMSLVSSAGAFSQTVASSWAGGSGTEVDPYQIANIAQMRKLASDCNRGISFKGKYFCLTADIRDNDRVLNSDGSLISNYSRLRLWTPVGMLKDSPFQGSFDGRGHSISGIYGGCAKDEVFGIVPNGKDDGGIFTYVDNAVFKNIVIKDSFLSTMVRWPDNAEFRDCVNYATVLYALGGDCIKGSARTVFINCGNYGISYAAGIASGHWGGKFEFYNCYNFGEVRISYYVCGGIAGNPFIMHNCVNYGRIVNPKGYPTGGLFRWSYITKESRVNVGNCVSLGAMDPFGLKENAAIATYVNAKNSYKYTIENVYWLETVAPTYGSDWSNAKCKGDRLKMTEDEIKSQDFLDKLNANASALGPQCCGWKAGSDGMPLLDIIADNHASVGSVCVGADELSDATVSYYNLQGQKVANPGRGVYIKVKGSKREKVIL